MSVAMHQGYRTVIALVGKTAAGKSTVAEILKHRYGFEWVRTRDIVRAIAGTPGRPSESLQQVGLRVMDDDGAARFSAAVSEILPAERPAVIDAIRPWSHYHALCRTSERLVRLVAVSADIDTRRARFEARPEGDRFELRENAPVEAEVPSLVESACYTICNVPPLPLEYRIATMLALVMWDEPLPSVRELHQVLGRVS
jgi:cytidylate kinase